MVHILWGALLAHRWLAHASSDANFLALRVSRKIRLLQIIFKVRDLGGLPILISCHGRPHRLLVLVCFLRLILRLLLHIGWRLLLPRCAMSRLHPIVRSRL